MKSKLATPTSTPNAIQGKAVQASRAYKSLPPLSDAWADDMDVSGFDDSDEMRALTEFERKHGSLDSLLGGQ